MSVRILDALNAARGVEPRNLGVSALALLLLCSIGRAAPDAPSEPDWLEEVPGESSIWVEPAGLGVWLTDRAPAGDRAPLVFGVGFGHRVGPARLAWRLHLFQGADDAALTFIYGDLVSVEQVMAEGTWRPFWRVALGVGLDLRGAHRSLGQDGYFNAENGASAGVGLAHGWGLDAHFADDWFARIEATGRAYTGAGRSGVVLSSHLGLGMIW